MTLFLKYKCQQKLSQQRGKYILTFPKACVTLQKPTLLRVLISWYPTVFKPLVPKL